MISERKYNTQTLLHSYIIWLKILLNSTLAIHEKSIWLKTFARHCNSINFLFFARRHDFDKSVRFADFLLVQADDANKMNKNWRSVAWFSFKISRRFYRP